MITYTKVCTYNNFEVYERIWIDGECDYWKSKLDNVWKKISSEGSTLKEYLIKSKKFYSNIICKQYDSIEELWLELL